MITDKRARDRAAKREMLPSEEHRQSRYLNNRAENVHQPTRKRERVMQRCTSAGHAQRVLAAFGPIRGQNVHDGTAYARRSTVGNVHTEWRSGTR
jgi:putative transposase